MSGLAAALGGGAVRLATVWFLSIWYLTSSDKSRDKPQESALCATFRKPLFSFYTLLLERSGRVAMPLARRAFCIRSNIRGRAGHQRHSSFAVRDLLRFATRRSWRIQRGNCRSDRRQQPQPARSKRPGRHNICLPGSTHGLSGNYFCAWKIVTLSASILTCSSRPSPPLTGTTFTIYVPGFSIRPCTELLNSPAWPMNLPFT